MSAGIAPAAPAPPPPAGATRLPYEWWERFLASDPGLNRLRTAGQAVASIAAAMLCEWLLVRFTGALQVPVPPGHLTAEQAAAIAAQHHAATVLAIMCGAVVCMVSSFIGPQFSTPLSVLGALALAPVPMLAGLSLGLALAPHHLIAVGSMVAVLAAFGYLRRFGPRGFFAGQLLFMGDFFGFFLSRVISIADIGALVLIVCIGSAVSIISQFTLFYPSRRSALRRMRRSFRVRSSQVAAAALDLLDDPGDQGKIRRLYRLLIRLNETALMIDGQLADPAALPKGATAAALHQRVFDAELTLTNTARFAERLSTSQLPDYLLDRIRDALRAARDNDEARAEAAAAEIRHWLQAAGRQQDSARRAELEQQTRLSRTTQIVLHRFTTSVIGYAEVARSVHDQPEPHFLPDAAAFDSAVELSGPWLPGSQQVSATASTERGANWLDRARLEPYERVTIQLVVSVTAAIVIGSVVSPTRFYWAVIATFVTFLGAHNATEQIRKGVLRVVGTVIGVFVGVLLAHVIGNNTAVSIVVILLSLFFGVYLLRVSYAFMVTGITVMLSQLYVQLHEFSTGLLLLRLAETAVGASIAALTVAFVLPVRTRQVVAVATRGQLEALLEVVDLAVQRLRTAGDDQELRAAARRLDVAYQALESATSPTRVRLPGAAGAGLRAQFWYAATASRYYARNLVLDTALSTPLPDEIGDHLGTATRLLATSGGEISEALQHRDFEQRVYLRSASLFDRVAGELDDQDVTTPRQLALRDLELIDGALASLATSVRMQVQGLDTDTGDQPAGDAADR
ncbi:FUSC family protein [Microlunatus elymi]|uniref:FUSC family protein n=1 Tax=Microlunatus elymi TaxID=2596828 RepID=A0A516PX92_9ACTN|nr:FUSC family protein [Microlunatus elymi]QDP95793.1 FUSC family protein [Microlunatus elymi]